MRTRKRPGHIKGPPPIVRLMSSHLPLTASLLASPAYVMRSSAVSRVCLRLETNTNTGLIGLWA